MGLLIPQKFSSLQDKLTKEQQQAIAQANTLEKSGLVDEAIIVYEDILDKSPTLKIAFDKLKKIYINTERLAELMQITDRYLNASDYSITSKIDVLDTYIITNKEWKDIVELLYNKPINLAHIKKILTKNLGNIANIWTGEGKNPYIESIQKSSYFIVTSD